MANPSLAIPEPLTLPEVYIQLYMTLYILEHVNYVIIEFLRIN